MRSEMKSCVDSLAFSRPLALFLPLAACIIVALSAPALAASLVIDEGEYTDLKDLKIRKLTLQKKQKLGIVVVSGGNLGSDGVLTMEPGKKAELDARGGKSAKVHSSKSKRRARGSHKFSFPRNNSGGTLDRDGTYVAGKKTDVIDVVRVKDAAGKTAEMRILVRSSLARSAILDSPLASTSIAAIKWPGNPLVPIEAVDRLPFAPGKSMIASTLTPEFAWPRYPGATSYKLYVGAQPFSSLTAVLAIEIEDPLVGSATLVPGASSSSTPPIAYRYRNGDAARPLAEGGKYSFAVFPKDKDGKFLVKAEPGFLSNFLPRADGAAVIAAGVPSLLSARLNDVSSYSFDRHAVIDKELAPDGKLVLSGRLANPASLKSGSVSYDNGHTWSPLIVDASTGDYAHTLALIDGTTYRPLMKLEHADTAIVTRLPGDLETLRYIALTERQRIQKLLDTLRDAFIQNDRTKLLSIVDKDYISKEPGFTDYQQFENTIRDQFNKTTTSFCRWNSENVEIVTPGKYLKVSFSWTQTINFSNFIEAREFKATARLDLRKIDGEWKIREDLDRKIFVKDYGLIPAPPS